MSASGRITQLEAELSRVTRLLEAERRERLAFERARDASSRSEELYRMMVKHAGVGIGLWDVEGRLIMANPAIQEMLGFDELELQGQEFLQTTHPDDSRPSAELAEALLRAERDRGGIESRYCRKDGTFIWANTSLALVRDEEGVAQYWLAIVEDVTERKLAVLRLRETHERLSQQQAALFELATSDCMLSGDLDATFRRATQMAADLMNVERVSVWELNETATSLLSSDLYEASRNRHSNTRRREIVDCPMYMEALSNSPVVATSDPQEDSRTSEYWRLYLEPIGISSMLDAVIRVDGRPAAVLCNHHVGQKREWMPEHANFVRRLADLLGRAIEQRDRADDRRSLKDALNTINTLRMRVEDENIYLRERSDSEWTLKEPVGNSSAWMRVMRRCKQVAQTDAAVLLLGETGTGKDTVAQTIHNRSARRDFPLVHVSCAALPGSLIESELFGHERGAFTGAIEKRLGRFEIANRGTLFLDEVGDLPGELQTKLLRVLERGEFERVGSTDTQRVNVRLIAATNRDLEQDVADGRFREDLYYRISVFPIWLPPLRNRVEDIPLLAWYFANRLRNKLAKPIDSIPQDALDILTSYHWPGNVRELENVIERAMILSSSTALTIDDSVLGGRDKLPDVRSVVAPLEDVQRTHIRSVLERCGWRIKGKGNAAELLGINPSTLYARMKKLGIHRPATRTHG